VSKESEMIKGSEIYQIYDAMERICIDLNSIVVALDQIMQHHGFIPHNGLRWDTSEALNSPILWLPYFTQRTYRKGNKTKKVIGVNILFKDRDFDNKIPFVVCGVNISDKDISTKNELLYSAGWHPNSKVTQVKDMPFTVTVEDDPDVNNNILTYFLPLTSISNVQTITKLIVRPLVSMYDKVDNFDNFDNFDNLKDIGNSIERETITLDDIMLIPR